MHGVDSLQQMYAGAVPTPVPLPGVSSWPPKFTWAPSHGPTAESRAPAAMAGFLSGAQALGGAFVGGAGMLRMGEMLGWKPPNAVVLASRLDPLTAGIDAGISSWAGLRSGAGVVRSGLAATGAGLGVYALGEMATAAMSHTIGGFRQQAALHHQMQGSFFNAGAVDGRGYGARDLQQVGGMLRQIDRRDPFTSMGDIGGMVGSFHQMGMQQGLRDAQEGAQKLRDMVNTVRSMSRALGDSIEEATRTFAGLRASGVYTRGGTDMMMKNMQAAETMGVSRDAFMGASIAGAQMARANGMAGSAGTLLTGGAMRGLGLDIGRGRLSSEWLMDATGGANLEEATVLMGQGLANRSLGVLGGTAVGKAILATVGAKQGGKYTGGLDTAALDRLMNGGKLSDLTKTGQRNMGFSAASKASFVTKQEDIMSSLASSNNGEDLLALIGNLAMEEGKGDEDMAKIYLEHLGVRDRREADMIIAASKDRAQRRREGSRRLRQTLSANELRERQKLGLSRGGLTTIAENLTSPFEDLGASMSTTASMAMEHAKDSLYGISRYNLTDSTYESMSMDMAGGKLAAPEGVRGNRYGGMSGRFIPALQAMARGIDKVGSYTPMGAVTDTALGAVGVHGGIMGGAMGLVGDAFALSDEAYGMRMELQQTGGLDLTAEIAAMGGSDRMREVLASEAAGRGAGGPNGEYGASLQSVQRTVQAGAALRRSGSFLDSVSAGFASTFRGDFSKTLHHMGQGFAKATTGNAATLIAMGASGNRRNAAVLSQMEGGSALLGDTLAGDLTDTSGYLSQEDAKARYYDALKGAGLGSDEADRLSTGGGTSALLYDLQKLQGGGADVYGEYGSFIDQIRGTMEYGKSTDKESYEASQLAAALSQRLGKTIDPASAKDLVKLIRRDGAFGGAVDNRDAFLKVLSAGGGVATQAFVNERKQAALAGLRGGSANVLRSLAGGSISALEATAAGTDNASFLQQMSTNGGVGSLIDNLANEGSIEKLREGGATDRAVASSLQTYLSAQRAGTNEDILRLYGVEKDSSTYKSLVGKERGELLDLLATESVGGAISQGGTGGTTMLRGNMSPREVDLELAQSLERLSATQAALYNQLVEKGTITGEKVTVPSAQSLGTGFGGLGTPQRR